jgi:hypothetical protein
MLRQTIDIHRKNIKTMYPDAPRPISSIFNRLVDVLQVLRKKPL